MKMVFLAHDEAGEGTRNIVRIITRSSWQVRRQAQKSNTPGSQQIKTIYLRIRECKEILQILPLPFQNKQCTLYLMQDFVSCTFPRIYWPALEITTEQVDKVRLEFSLEVNNDIRENKHQVSTVEDPKQPHLEIFKARGNNDEITKPSTPLGWRGWRWE